ncbi:MAG TPA: hypothetical protein VJ142_03035 [Candidatus Nanoarchaeia archaeon]|nr:hypothetical protein [Candidatus Nanoarchaeia archaeon]
MKEAEYKRKVIDYLKKNMGKGYAPESLKWALVKQGYSRTIVDSAIREANKEFSKENPVLKEKPVITHEIIGENDQPIVDKPWWKRILGLD